jgi:hypothetical protein
MPPLGLILSALGRKHPLISNLVTLSIYAVFASHTSKRYSNDAHNTERGIGNVLDPGKGVCADPVERVAILEVKELGPPGGASERQLSPDRGGKKT